MGNTTERITKIWDDLISSLELKPTTSGLRKFDSEKYLKLVQDPAFYRNWIMRESIKGKVQKFRSF